MSIHYSDTTSQRQDGINPHINIKAGYVYPVFLNCHYPAKYPFLSNIYYELKKYLSCVAKNFIIKGKRKRGEKMNSRTISRKAALFLLAAIFIIALIFTACGTRSAAEGGEVFKETEALMVEEAPAMEMVEEEFAADEGRAVSEDVQYSDTPNTVDRKVIKTAYMELEVEKGKFDKVLFDITRLAEKNGGFVSHTQSYSDAEGNLTSGSITIRIPHDQYNPALDSIKGMGTVKSISVSGQDVTQEYTDLESRLRNLEAQEEILLDLMAQSKDVSDSIEVQRELSYVTEQIEVIKGRMNYLDNMVSFSTIDIYLFEPQPISDDPGWGFLEALRRGLRGAVSVFNGILVFVISASPILAFIAVVLVIVWLIIRGRRRRRAKKEKK